MAETARRPPAPAGAEPALVAGPAGTEPQRPRSVAAARAVRAGDGEDRSSRRELAELSRMLREVQTELGQLRAKTDEVNRSAQFTEAYLTIGLPERMAEVLRTDVAAADRWRHAHAAQARRTRRAWAAALALGAVLLLEVQTGWVGALAADAVSLSVSALQDRLG